MHTYRHVSAGGKSGWQVGFDTGSTVSGSNFAAIGPQFEHQHEAAAYAAFLNGGKYEPAAVEEILKPPEPTPEQKAAKAEEERQAKEAEKAEQAERKRPPDYPQVEEKPKPRAHAARAKQHVKHATPKAKVRKHK